MDAILTVERIRKTWDILALDDVSFQLPPGHIAGIAGPNGSGKTTLIRLVLGLARPDSGAIQVFGKDPHLDGPGIRSRIGFVLDQPTSYDYLTVARMGRLVASFYPSWDKSEFQGLLDAFELPRRRRISALSRGMRVKLALALALAHDADLLVLDEPTTGLDPVFRRELLARLSEVISDGRKSVLFSTQILTDLERVADFAVFLRRGRVLFSGPKDDLLDRWMVARGYPEPIVAAGTTGVRGMRKAHSGFDILFDNVEDAERYSAGAVVLEHPTLDDVFLLLGSDGST